MTPSRPPGRVETLNGQQLYFEVLGTGKPLLLLHGFSGSSQDWIPSLDQWGTNFQLILPDAQHTLAVHLPCRFSHASAAAAQHRSKAWRLNEEYRIRRPPSPSAFSLESRPAIIHSTCLPAKLRYLAPPLRPPK